MGKKRKEDGGGGERGKARVNDDTPDRADDAEDVRAPVFSGVSMPTQSAISSHITPPPGARPTLWSPSEPPWPGRVCWGRAKSSPETSKLVCWCNQGRDAKVPALIPASGTSSTATKDFYPGKVSPNPAPAHARAPPDHVLTSPLFVLRYALNAERCIQTKLRE